MSNLVSVHHNSLKELVQGIFSSLDVPAQEAYKIADHLVRANLRGVDSHGVSRVKIYTKRLELGLVNKETRTRLIRETPVSAVLDGGNGSGIVAASRAMELAVEKAIQSGIGTVCARHSNHCGMLAYYTQQAVDRGLIALATTSASPTMAPLGAAARFFGANPLSYGIPTGGEGDIIFDMSTSNVSRGRIILAARSNHQIPLGWALTSDGKETTDPEAALDGLLLPLGGAKGSGIAFFVEVLSSVLSGANFGPHIPSLYEDFDNEQNIGHFFLAFRPDLFLSSEEFTGRIARMIQEVRELPVAEGHEKIYLPGELEIEREKERRKEGIPLTIDVIEELEEMSDRYDAPASLR
jgi:ureidoglycolate dehydrogenase (NAD+)